MLILNRGIQLVKWIKVNKGGSHSRSMNFLVYFCTVKKVRIVIIISFLYSVIKNK